MIPYRTLIKWRKEALHVRQLLDESPQYKSDEVYGDYYEVNNRLLVLTQELIDKELIKRK